MLLKSCLRSGAHLIDVGCELGEDRNLSTASGCRGKSLDQLRHLPYIRAEASFRHVGTGEIELDRIRPVLFAKPCQALPVLVILTHDGCQYEFIGIFCFQAAEHLHILLHTVVGELFHVLEPYDAAAVAVDRRIAG